MRACGRHEAQDAEVVRRSLVRDQGGGIGEQNDYWRPAFNKRPLPIEEALRPGRLSRRGRCSLQSYERTCGRFPDTAIVWCPLETHVEAITQLPSGELRAGAVKARRPRADHARG